MRSKRSKNFFLFLSGHLGEIKCSPKFGRDFIELGGRNFQVAMGFFQSNRSAAWFRGCILEGPTRNVANP